MLLVGGGGAGDGLGCCGGCRGYGGLLLLLAAIKLMDKTCTCSIGAFSV